MFWLWTFLIYWLLLFVASYIVVEVGQKHYYDEVTPFAGLKVGGSTLVLAVALTWRESWASADPLDLFLNHVWFTGILAIAGFVLFCLAIRFHAPHALLLGPPTVVLVAFTAAMAVDSLSDAGRSVARERPIPPAERTIRRSSSTALDTPIAEPAPATKPATKARTTPGAP